MKKPMIALSLSALIATAPAFAGGRHFDDRADRHGFHDKARVVDVEPLYETVRIPRDEQHCWNEQVWHREGGRRNDSHTGTILGGIIGGVVGNQLSRGKRAQDVVTVAGTLLGASIGHDLSRAPRDGERRYATTERRCEIETVYEEEERLAGYHVKYRYRGQLFETRTHDHPGKFIPVQVKVRPYGS